MSAIEPTLGAWLRHQRHQLDLTQLELAQQVNCSVVTIRKLERDELRPSKQLAERLAHSLHIAPEYQATIVAFARGIGPSPQLDATPAPASTAPLPQSVGIAVRHHNLPTQTMPLVGRETELLELQRLLERPDVRLVTMLGVGGMGKTHLAQEVARQYLARTQEPVFFVALASLPAAEGLTTAILDALGSPLQPDGRPPEQQLLDYLQPKQMLLVLDNFEHLLTGAGLVNAMLRVAPGVKILVTSRERLLLSDETLYVLGNLAYPAAATTTDLLGYGAVKLFLQRARHLRPTFELSAADPAAIVRICHLVEGLPLGILLAAAWVNQLSLSAIADEISQSLDFLESELRDLPEHHRSIRAVFAHSWRRLTETDRQVFMQLAIFRGGFTRQAAQRVAGASLPILRSLVNQSLLQVGQDDRYTLHELLRQYALEQLAARGEEDQIRERHCLYYAEYAQQREVALKSKREKEFFVALSTEFDNIREGWHWAVAHGHHTTIELYLDSVLDFYNVRGWYQEGVTAFGKAVEILRSSTAEQTATLLLGKMLTAQGVVNGLAHRYDLAKACLEESLAIFQRLDARHNMAYPLQELGDIAVFRGLFAEAKPLFEESLIIYTEYNDRYGIMKGLSQLGWAMLKLGEIETATAVLQQSLALFRSQGPPSDMLWVLGDLGDIALGQGKYAEALAYYQESLMLSEETDYSRARAFTLGALGWIHLDLGDYSQAQQDYQEGLALFSGLGIQPHVKWMLGMLSYVAILCGELVEAKAYLNEIVSLASNTDGKKGWWYCSVQGELALAQGAPDEAEAYFQRSIALFEDATEFEDMNDTNAYGGGLAWPLNGLGRAAYLRKEYATSRQKFEEALLITQQLPSVPEELDILAGMAALFAALGESVRAVELVGYIQHHPASRQRTKERTAGLLAEMAERLSASEIDATLNKSQDKGVSEIFLSASFPCV